MPHRTRTIVTLSAAVALSAAALLPTAGLAKGPGGNADCSSDCSADQPQLQQQVRARDGSGAGSTTQAEANARGVGGARARNAQAPAGAPRGKAAAGAPGGNAAVDAPRRNARLGAGQGPNADGERGPGTCAECTAEMGTLTDEQAAGVIFMANEEKLAHDIYTAFAEQYGVRVFENIAASEALHQEAVNVVLERYGLEDPAIGLPTGEFSDPVISELYASLLEQGSASLDEAIAVGLLIEETDIADLEARMVELEVTAPDVYQLYSHLLAASGNHQNAFEAWS